MNPADLTDTELKIIFLIRKLRLFDTLEIKYSKQGELWWQATQTDRGKFDFTQENMV